MLKIFTKVASSVFSNGIKGYYQDLTKKHSYIISTVLQETVRAAFTLINIKSDRMTLMFSNHQLTSKQSKGVSINLKIINSVDSF